MGKPMTLKYQIVFLLGYFSGITVLATIALAGFPLEKPGIATTLLLLSMVALTLSLTSLLFARDAIRQKPPPMSPSKRLLTEKEKDIMASALRKAARFRVANEADGKEKSTGP